MGLRIEQIKRPRIRPYGFKILCTGIPWGARTRNTEILRMIEWILFNIGSIDTNKWEMRGYGPSYLNIYFSSEGDAIAFKMRWM